MYVSKICACIMRVDLNLYIGDREIDSCIRIRSKIWVPQGHLRSTSRSISIWCMIEIHLKSRYTSCMIEIHLKSFTFTLKLSKAFNRKYDPFIFNLWYHIWSLKELYTSETTFAWKIVLTPLNNKFIIKIWNSTSFTLKSPQIFLQ